MKIKAIETFLVTLPFRISFGHSLATRAKSTNLIVRVTLEDGTQGYGEGVPRDYVTGENAEIAEHNVESIYAPHFVGFDVSDKATVVRKLEETAAELGLENRPQGASWCALELAVLDATAKAHQISLAAWFGQVVTPVIRYGGVVPFGGKNALLGMLLFYRIYGFDTVKIKVGGTELANDVAKVAMARKILGPNATIRVDSNCAWTADETLRAAEAFEKYNVASYEQPVPPDDLKGLKRVTDSIAAAVMADESLCTIEQAQMLASEGICNAFNIRISKVGGFLAAQKMVAIAQRHNISCQLGAQVGESGILSAAARIFGSINPRFANYEGSMNGFLLKSDLTNETLTVGVGGYGDLSFAKANRFGLGVSISEGTLESWSLAHGASEHELERGAEFLAHKPN